jgi:ABC-type bacteriocin/lantibiotic exporter with double-glycine peptidase domain
LIGDAERLPVCELHEADAVFCATGKSGLGHLRRVTNIASALHQLDPSLKLVLVTNSTVAGSSKIAVVLQDAALFNATVRDNILYGKLEAGEMDVVRAAAAAGAHEFIMSLPEGYDTVVGERGALLSGGQRQRILLARAFIRDARILIFDEPLVGLDSESEMHVRRAMQTLMRARTTIIITHDPDVARMADRVLTISRGRVYEIEPNGIMRIGPAQ